MIYIENYFVAVLYVGVPNSQTRFTIYAVTKISQLFFY